MSVNVSKKDAREGLVRYPWREGDLELARKYVKRWKAKLNLQNWRVSVRLTKHTDMARLERVSFDGKVAGIYLGADAGYEPMTDYQLEKLVLHELLHLSVYSIKAFVKATEMVDHEDVIAAEHDHINILEELLMPDEHEPKVSNSTVAPQANQEVANPAAPKND